MNVLRHPDLRLKRVCKPVLGLDRVDVERVVEMFEMLKRTKPIGIGLAAAQVDWDARLFVMNIDQTPQDEFLYVNPEVVWSCEKQIVSIEGCLSVEEPMLVRRPSIIRAKAAVFSGISLRFGLQVTNPNELVKEFRLNKLHARCFQHELDHLNGVTIADVGRLPRFK